MESPPNFCAASETARDVTTWYTEAAVGSLEEHKCLKHAMGGEDVSRLPRSAAEGATLKYFVEVYVDDFIPMAIATSQD